MAAGAGPAVLAAVNADFFTPDGATLGPEVVDGMVTGARRRPAVAWKPGQAPWLGVAELVEGGLRLGWLVPRSGGDGVTQAVGGFPDLLDEAAPVGDLEVGARPGFAASRHPRTAVGWDADAGRLWLVVVDGRQAPRSAGMALPELAELMKSLGAEEAVNLDGGGSSTLVVGGRVRNHPSDSGGERPVANALAVVRDATACRTSSGR